MTMATKDPALQPPTTVDRFWECLYCSFQSRQKGDLESASGWKDRAKEYFDQLSNEKIGGLFV